MVGSPRRGPRAGELHALAETPPKPAWLPYLWTLSSPTPLFAVLHSSQSSRSSSGVRAALTPTFDFRLPRMGNPEPLVADKSLIQGTLPVERLHVHAKRKYQAMRSDRLDPVGASACIFKETYSSIESIHPK